MDNHNSEHDSHQEHHSHVKLMAYVFAALLVLTVVTVLVAYYIHFETAAINILIAMAIATLKVSLVIYYFMHLKWEDKTTKWFAAISLPLLALLIGFGVWDVSIRVVEKLFLF